MPELIWLYLTAMGNASTIVSTRQRPMAGSRLESNFARIQGGCWSPMALD